MIWPRKNVNSWSGFCSFPFFLICPKAQARKMVIPTAPYLTSILREDQNQPKSPWSLQQRFRLGFKNPPPIWTSLLSWRYRTSWKIYHPLTRLGLSYTVRGTTAYPPWRSWLPSPETGIARWRISPSAEKVMEVSSSRGSQTSPTSTWMKLVRFCSLLVPRISDFSFIFMYIKLWHMSFILLYSTRMH